MNKEIRVTFKFEDKKELIFFVKKQDDQINTNYCHIESDLHSVNLVKLFMEKVIKNIDSMLDCLPDDRLTVCLPCNGDCTDLYSI